MQKYHSYNGSIRKCLFFKILFLANDTDIRTRTYSMTIITLFLLCSCVSTTSAVSPCHTQRRIRSVNCSPRVATMPDTVLRQRADTKLMRKSCSVCTIVIFRDFSNVKPNQKMCRRYFYFNFLKFSKMG